MTDQQQSAETSSDAASWDEAAWHEVGEQFRTLGESIARTARVTWEREETRHHVQELRTGLESLVRNMEQAIQDFSESPEGQRLRDEAKRAAVSAREAGDQAWEDAQPHVLAALRRVNAELKKVVNGLEVAPGGKDEPATRAEE